MEFPQHEKLKSIQKESQALGQFLDWLNSEGIALCQLGERDHFFPIYKRTEVILANYFDIDLDLLEQEKLEMLKQLRGTND